MQSVGGSASACGAAAPLSALLLHQCHCTSPTACTATAPVSPPALRTAADPPQKALDSCPARMYRLTPSPLSPSSMEEGRLSSVIVLREQARQITRAHTQLGHRYNSFECSHSDRQFVFRALP